MSDISSRASSPALSPTTSAANSLVSLKTQENNELYDHRQQSHNLPTSKIQSTKNPATGSRKKFKDEQLKQDIKTLSKSMRITPDRKLKSKTMDFEELDSDDDINSRKLEATLIQSYNNANNVTHTTSLKDTLYLGEDITSGNFNHRKPKSRATSMVSNTSSKNPLTALGKSRSYNNDSSDRNSNHAVALKRKNSVASVHSEVSHNSRDTQETEEDVCFPMQPPLHTRVNGIDFDELQEFAQFTEEMELQNLPTQNQGLNGSTSASISSAALKYTPKFSLKSEVKVETSSESTGKEKHDDTTPSHSGSSEYNPKDLPQTSAAAGISFGNNKIEGEEDDTKSKAFQSSNGYTYGDTSGFNYPGNFRVPNRFSYFCSDLEETVHGTDIASLVSDGKTFYELFRGGKPTWWLDCSCPTDDEMRCIAKAFGIHPLTAEDIRMQETREKVELFKSYYFVCFHTFENDNESEDFLEPINVYIVVFRTGVLSFHFGSISHAANVRRRVRQLRDYVNVNSDWICYALIDDITDSFAPVIQSIEYEADAIEDSVFMGTNNDFSNMLRRIGESRRKTMTLMRLLSGKADVIKMFAKRCHDEANGIGPALTSNINIANLQADSEFTSHAYSPRGDIALYLGDIQDHLLTMFQNLVAYEKIFSRSHSNYLAQLQVESFNSNNRVTEMLGKVTLIGTMLVPLNVITGLFGMNVKVPGQDSSIKWWFSILGILIALSIVIWIVASYWIKRVNNPHADGHKNESSAKSIISSVFSKSWNQRRNDRRVNHIQGGGTNRSIASLPSKLSRYD